MDNAEPIISVGCWADGDKWPGQVPLDPNAVVVHLKMNADGSESSLLEFHDPQAGVHVFPA